MIVLNGIGASVADNEITSPLPIHIVYLPTDEIGFLYSELERGLLLTYLS